MNKNTDLWGSAIWDFFHKGKQNKLFTETTISTKDEFFVEYLFRGYEQMPEIEQKALDMSYGKVLEVGCAVASHGLYLQNKKNLSVTSVDISSLAIEVAKLRGLKNAVCSDVYQITGSFNTILLLMNGAGLCARIKHLNRFFQHLKKLLTPDGQILLDSTDIIYMFDQNPNGSYDVPVFFDYYGEVDFTLHYKGKTQKFPWFYIHFELLEEIAQANGLKCNLVIKGTHYDYLAQLSLK